MQANLNFDKTTLPKFSAIDVTTIKQNLLSILTENREKLKEILLQSRYTWDNFMQPLEDMGDKLSKFWSPISHLHSVKESEELRAAYNESLPMLVEYYTEMSQNDQLYQGILTLSESDEFKTLTKAQQKIIENDIRDFKLSGIHLGTSEKAKLAELQKRMSELTTKFSENLLDATHAFSYEIQNEADIKGLPPQAVALVKQAAETKGLKGYLLTLDFPCYSAVMKFLENESIRRLMYEAYVTRASDQGPNANKWDNTPIMEEILKIRHDMAELIGFKNYAEYSLATKMAKTPHEVTHFLWELLKKSKPYADQEFSEIEKFAKAHKAKLEVWDTSYYSEKYREEKFDFSPEDLRPYFPIKKVLNGLFTIVETLYGIKIKEESDVDVWEKEVKFFSLYDKNGSLRAAFYIDLYARNHKRDGAWMDECMVRRKLEGKLQYPVAYLTCNFMPPVGSTDALLNHDEVETLFHEFGHCLHHMLTKVDYASVSGINGVPWDAVEFPSQFMENFCWKRETLDMISGHYQTGEPIPEILFNKMVAAKHFQTGLQMVRQIEFALFDFRIHHEYDPHRPRLIQDILEEVRKETSTIAVPEFNRFQHSFSHIFAGGYAAGYYSYKWAEVLSADAFEAFEEHGVLNQEVGQSFMENILEVGGVRHPMDSFIAFRGRQPKIDALLKQSGIVEIE